MINGDVNKISSTTRQPINSQSVQKNFQLGEYSRQGSFQQNSSCSNQLLQLLNQLLPLLQQLIEGMNNNNSSCDHNPPSTSTVLPERQVPVSSLNISGSPDRIFFGNEPLPSPPVSVEYNGDVFLITDIDSNSIEVPELLVENRPNMATLNLADGSVIPLQLEFLDEGAIPAQ